jgi:hypothetical protein
MPCRPIRSASDPAVLCLGTWYSAVMTGTSSPPASFVKDAGPGLACLACPFAPRAQGAGIPLRCLLEPATGNGRVGLDSARPDSWVSADQLLRYGRVGQARHVPRLQPDEPRSEQGFPNSATPLPSGDRTDEGVLKATVLDPSYEQLN